MKDTRDTTTMAMARDLARQFHLSPTKALELVMQAQMISAVNVEVKRRRLTHVQLAARSGVSYTIVRGILSGGMQGVKFDDVLRLVEAVGLTVDAKAKRAA